jgi:hypothetical protein
MSQVLFLNPHKRGTKARKVKRRAKTKRRTRKLFANPVMPRRKRKARRTRQGYRMARRVGRTMRRNPIKLPRAARPGTVVREQLIPAVQGAVGAIAVSAANGMLIDKLPIPAQYKQGAMRDVLKGLTAVAISVFATKVAKNPTSKNIAVGAMTMVMADAARRLMLKAMPTVTLAGLENELFSPLGYWTQPAQLPALGFDNSGGNLSMYTPPVADTATAFDPMLVEYDYASGVSY